MAADPRKRCWMWSRREFGRRAAAACFIPLRRQEEQRDASAVALVRGGDRRHDVARALDLAGTGDLGGRETFLKADYGNPNPYPATTHPETLEAVVRALRQHGAGPITLLERSGLGRTRDIWEFRGTARLARGLGIRLLALDEMPRGEWRKADPEVSHWSRGFEIPKFLGPDALLFQVSNLKTHRFGGYFSASLKNALGLVARLAGDDPAHNYMEELHGSEHQRRMIAEAAWAFRPAMVLMDAREVFIVGGPEKGETAAPGVIMACADRAALDAAGVALLDAYGAGFPISGTPVFEQEQLARASELGLGASSAKEIRFVTHGPGADLQARQLQGILEVVGDPRKSASHK